MIKKLAGFTLIEMLVTIAILSLIAGLVLGYSRQAERTTMLKRMADKLVSDLRQCQSRSLSAEGGYGCGIYIKTPTSYIIFFDKNNTKSYESDKDGPISSENLSPGIQFKIETTGLTLVFQPPLGEVWKNGSQNQSVDIVLELANNPSLSRTVSVSSFGSISY